MLALSRHGVYLAGYRPEEALHSGACREVHKADVEELKGILACLHGIVPLLYKTVGRWLVPNIVEVANKLVCILADNLCLAEYR